MSNTRFQKRRQLKKLSKKLSTLMLEELTEILEEDATKEKRIWVRKWLSDRELSGGSALLLNQLRLEDTREYRSVLRMTPENFDELFSLVTSSIQRQDTFMRDALPAKLKLELTLNYLATGNSFRSMSHFYRVSMSSISNMIPEVCLAICEVLKDSIKVPSTEEEWQKIEDGFRTRWNFPSCYGAIDGKHVAIKAPMNSGSEFFNYKKTNSIVLLAIADDNYCFSYIDVGANGSASDGGVFKNCSIYQALENGSMLPQNGVIVGDAAFPLKTYLMKPYPGDNLDIDKRIFNYRLSRARRIVENAFGILVSRFRVFEKPIPTNLNTVDAIVRAACTLHNWLRKKSNTYITGTCVDREDHEGNLIQGAWRAEINALNSISIQGSNHSANAARAKRELYKRHFINAGSVAWQLEKINQ